MSVRLPALAMAISAGLCGCATVEHGTLDSVAVITDPPGARVSSPGTICLSPCAVSVSRKEAVSVVITKAGYVTQTASSAVKVDEAAVAAASSTFLTPDVLGRITDVQDGAYGSHVPAAIVVKLVPVK